MAVITDVNVIISGELLALNLHIVASVITFIHFPKNSVNLSEVEKTSGLITALLEVMIIEPDCQNQYGMCQSRLRVAISGIRRYRRP